jgi:hypothetical protein
LPLIPSPKYIDDEYNNDTPLIIEDDRLLDRLPVKDEG